jgi:Nucleotidyltransferase domain
MPKAFLTGSRVYGQPTPESDVDLVVFISEEDKETLVKLADTALPIRFGKLNVIALTNEDEFYAWKSATREVQAARSKNGGKALDKAANCAIFEAELAACGWPYDKQSTPTADQKEEIKAYKAYLNDRKTVYTKNRNGREGIAY